MSCWIALSSGEAPSATALGWWALQFTPRVALVGRSVVMELQSSLRLFGGAARLCERIATESQALGCPGGRTARTAAAALACLRHHPAWHDEPQQGWVADLPDILDPLPLAVLPAAAEHASTLATLGCRTLSDVRRLPRGGISRRFGSALLNALDQAYGQQAEVFDWLTTPEVFEQSVELPGRIEHADALLHGVAPLMHLLCAWLAGRHAGVRQFTLRWHHDGSRHDDLHPGQLVVHLADPSRDLDRLTRLLGEHLRRTVLQAPVDRLSLCADESIPLILHSEELFGELQDLSGGPALLDRLLTPAGQREHRQHLHALIERLSVRLGASHVCHGRLCADHRPEQAQQWLPLTAQSLGQMESLPSVNTIDGLPQPTWLLPKPRAVTASSLRLLAGPHRIEAGWWDLQAPAMTRDYYIAHSAQGGLLWVFRERAMSAGGRPAWFVHGLFA